MTTILLSLFLLLKLLLRLILSFNFCLQSESLKLKIFNNCLFLNLGISEFISILFSWACANSLIILFLISNPIPVLIILFFFDLIESLIKFILFLFLLFKAGDKKLLLFVKLFSLFFSLKKLIESVCSISIYLTEFIFDNKGESVFIFI